MATARKEILRENEVSFYQCITRCVRRSFLCGFDFRSNKSFEHRKFWVENRIKHLSKVFAINIGSYAVMSNHLHIVLKTRPDKSNDFSDEEVLNRWNLLYPKYSNKDGKTIDIPEKELALLLLDKDRIEILRKRLSNVSWFMKSLNEHIARKANFEDKCKGRFWEGRFQCQLLLERSAILTCMAYVDLNPIRAELNEKIEESKHTSISLRLESFKAELILENKDKEKSENIKLDNKLLLKLERERQKSNWLAQLNCLNEDAFLNIGFKDYVDLVEWTGKQIATKKRGKIPEDLDSVIKRFEIDKNKWLKGVENYGSIFHRIAGKAEDILKIADSLKKSWFWGINNLEKNIST